MNKDYIADPVVIDGYFFNIPISFYVIKALGEACSREPHFVTVSSWNKWASIVKSGVEFVGELSALLPDVMIGRSGTVEEQINEVLNALAHEASATNQNLRSLVWCKTNCKEGDFIADCFSDFKVLRNERARALDDFSRAQARLVDIDRAINEVKLNIVGMVRYMEGSPSYKNSTFNGSNC